MTTPISCIVLALITVEEHMMMEPECGFTKVALIICVDCEVQVKHFPRLLAY